MIAAAAVMALATPPAAAARCPAPAERHELGDPRPFPAPDPLAVESNAAGKRHYRERRWDEARAAYRAALARDPSFRAPRLNIACSYVRQERFAEALAEVQTLVRTAYVPWSREVREAADLSALRPRPEWAQLQQAIDASAHRWGAAVSEGILYLARSKPPLTTAGQGTFVLGPRQEIVAYVPATGRHLTVTAEDGRVLAFARSPDGARVAYLLGGKLIRGPSPPVRLRELSVRMLELKTMRLGPGVAIAAADADVVAVELAFPHAALATLAVTSAAGGSRTLLVFDGESLERREGPRRAPGVHLNGAGARSAAARAPGPCGAWLEPVPGGPVPALRIRGPRAAPVIIDAPFGAALGGLPFSSVSGLANHPTSVHQGAP